MKVESLFCILVAMIILSGERSTAGDVSPAGDAPPDIAALIAAEDAAWNSGDAQRFAERVLSDVVFTNVVGIFSVGKAPFLARHERIFATIYKGSALHQTIQHLTTLTPDIVIVDTFCTLTDATHAPPGVELVDGTIHTRLEQVLVKRADGWWVASFHNVAVKSAATANAALPKP